MATERSRRPIARSSTYSGWTGSWSATGQTGWPGLDAGRAKEGERPDRQEVARDQARRAKAQAEGRKVGRYRPSFQLPPPGTHSIKPNLQIHCLLRGRVLQLAQLFLGNQQSPPIVQPHHQELKTRPRIISRPNDMRLLPSSFACSSASSISSSVAMSLGCRCMSPRPDLSQLPRMSELQALTLAPN
jgi:hypothetical protein